MKSRTLAVALLSWVLLIQAATPAQSQGTASSHLAAVINLENLLKEKPTATVDAGGGVSLDLAAVDGGIRQDLTIRADGPTLEKLAGGRFMACARLDVRSRHVLGHLRVHRGSPLLRSIRLPGPGRGRQTGALSGPDHGV